MLAQKKRRRKRKKSLAISQPSAVPVSVLTSKPINLVKPKPKLSQSFIKEEGEVKRALSTRSKETKLDGIPQTSIDEEIKFFTDHINISTFDIVPIVTVPSSEQTPSSGKTGDGPQLASSYIHDNDDVPVQKWTKRTLETIDNQLLYYPRRDRINLSVAQGEEITVSTISREDDDGFYSTPAPNVLERNKIQLINRLLEEGCPWLDWIDPKNPIEILGMSNCVDDTAFLRSKCSKEFIPIRFVPQSFETIVRDRAAQGKILKVQISDVIFEKHPAHNQEFNLAASIEFLHRQYKDRKQDQIVENLRNKLASVRHLLGEDPGAKTLRRDVQDLRNHTHREEKVDRDILKILLEQWKRLKSLRDKQGFNLTNVRVVIVAKDADEESDLLEWDREFNTELHEILEEMFQLYDADTQSRDNNGEDFESIKKLNRPDVDDVRNKLMEMYQNSKRHPGEPHLSIELERISATVPKNSVKSNHLFYSFEILFDGEKVSSGGCHQFGEINLNCMLTIKLTRKIPDTIQLLIYEEQRLRTKQKIVELFVPVPQEYDLFNSTPKTFMNFSSFQADISGKIGIKIGWSEVTYSKQDPVSFKKQTIQKAHEKIQNWYNDHLLDPMDPEVNTLIEFMQRSQIANEEQRSSGNEFRLNEDITAFCSAEELNNNKRLNMLRARFNNDLKARHKLVPHSEREVVLEDEDLRIIEELGWMDPIDIQRHKGKKYLKSVYEVITNHFEAMTESNDCQNLLIDDTPPSVSSFLSMIGQVFGPKRPLNPQRRAQATVRRTIKPSQVTNLKLVVNVIRATGIPMRTQEQNLSTRSNTEISPRFTPQRSNNTMPFVMVNFKDKSTRTTTTEGSNPTWNEQLTMPLSGTVLRGDIKGCISIQIFDEILLDLMDESHSRDSEIYQRICSNWIGELRIPLSTIYTTQKLEGTFELTSPGLLLGYTRPSVTSSGSSTLLDNLLETRNSIRLTLFISLEPNVEIPSFTTTQFECTELNETLNHIHIWLTELREEFPHRCKTPLVSLSNGKRVCITRLIGPINLPFQQTDVTEFLIRRFVSLIPVNQTGDFCTRLEGVWLTNDQVVSIMAGSYKDLGVLLACYYLSLSFNAFLVLGHTLLEGDTTFVLFRDQSGYFLVDPQSGKKYSSKDTLCPLIKVYSLVNGNNVWANVQKENRVFLTKFDVTIASEWRPLFNKSIKVPVGLIHNTLFEYRSSDDVSDLKRIIELKVMKKISSWRSDRKTNWNRNLSETLRQILVQLEEDTCFEYDKKAYADKLSGIMQTYKVTGFPLHMRYINLSSIVERVKMTGIHWNADNRVEFALGVHIQPYPNNVLSIWIFLVTLVPKVLSF